MPDEFVAWLTTDSITEPEIAKHSKAGLRILKKWLNFLSIGINVSLDKGNSMTSISLLIPKTIEIKDY